VKSVTAGAAHACALLDDGTARCWGAGWAGQRGDGVGSNQAAPQTVVDLAGASSLAAGFLFTCATLTDGTGRCWGDNSFGQIGDGTKVTRLAPTPILLTP
jgi:alpha-tubulin suppressor-like RCC1 family protein